MLITLDILLLLYGSIMSILGIALYITGGKFLIYTRMIKKKMLNQVKKIDLDTQTKHNKIAAMTMQELDQYLSMIYAHILLLSSDQEISERDPSSVLKLYGISLESMITYIGDRNIEILDYYYGKNMLIKWCELKYKTLEHFGIIPKIVDKTATEAVIFNVINFGSKENTPRGA